MTHRMIHISVAMLALSVAAVAGGQASNADSSASGAHAVAAAPKWFDLIAINAFVSSAGGVFATMLHKQYGQWVLLGLVLLHVVAIAFYRIVRRRSLVKAMMDGDKLLPKAMPPSRDDSVTRSMAAVLFVLCLTLVQSTVGA